MLGLIDLGHKLASVRSLHETPADFDEVAFQHIRRNFQRLLHYFNELSELTGQPPLQVEDNEPSDAISSLATSINATTPKS
jgi:tRNA A37 N6-isopentenylltransferase MiaA